MKKSELSDSIYQHYVEAYSWLGKDNSVSVATGLRNVHQVSDMLDRWKIPSRSVKLSIFYRSLRYAMPQGELRNRARWILDSSVGNLTEAVSLSEDFLDETVKVPILNFRTNYAPPRAVGLLGKGIVSMEWLRWFRTLTKEFNYFDGVQTRMLVNIYDLRALVFHAYLLASALHQGITIIDYSRSLRNIK
jgi:hypothetical protein